MKQLTVILVWKTGGDFIFEDVNILTFHLWKQGVKCYCLTDTLAEPIELVTVTLLPLENHWNGWWSKLNLFAPSLETLRPFLFMDLDTLINGDINQFNLTGAKQEGDLVMLEDFYKKTVPASGMMWIPANNIKVQTIYDGFISDSSAIIARYRGDQDYIASKVRPDKFWQQISGKIGTFKPKGKQLKEKPIDIDLVCFHGIPRIRQAATKYEWIKQYVDETR